MMNYETAGNAVKITFDKRPSTQLAGFLVNTLELKWDKGNFTTYSGTLSNRNIGFIQLLDEFKESLDMVKHQQMDKEFPTQENPKKDEVLPFAEEYLRELTFGDQQKNYDDFIQDKKENQQEKPDAIRRESQHPENALEHPDSQMKQKAGILEVSVYEKKVQASTRELLTDDNFKRFLESGIPLTGSGFSFRNTLLLLSQGVDPADVKSEDSWAACGRVPKENAKGYEIYAPVMINEVQAARIADDVLSAFARQDSRLYRIRNAEKTAILASFFRDKDGIKASVSGKRFGPFQTEEELRTFAHTQLAGKVVYTYEPHYVYKSADTEIPATLFVKEYKENELDLSEDGLPVINDGKFRIKNTPDRYKKYHPQPDTTEGSYDMERKSTLFSILVSVCIEKGLPVFEASRASDEILADGCNSYYVPETDGYKNGYIVVASDALLPDKITALLQSLAVSSIYPEPVKLADYYPEHAEEVRDHICLAAAYSTAAQFGLKMNSDFVPELLADVKKASIERGKRYDTLLSTSNFTHDKLDRQKAMYDTFSAICDRTSVINKDIVAQIRKQKLTLDLKKPDPEQAKIQSYLSSRPPVRNLSRQAR